MKTLFDFLGIDYLWNNDVYVDEDGEDIEDDDEDIEEEEDDIEIDEY